MYSSNPAIAKLQKTYWDSVKAFNKTPKTPVAGFRKASKLMEVTGSTLDNYSRK